MHTNVCWCAVKKLLTYSHHWACCILFNTGRGHAEWTYSLLSTRYLSIIKCSVVPSADWCTSLDLSAWMSLTLLTQSRCAATRGPLRTVSYSWPPRCTGTKDNVKWYCWSRFLPEMMSVSTTALKCDSFRQLFTVHNEIMKICRIFQTKGLIFFPLTIATELAVVCRGKPWNLRKCRTECTEFFLQKTVLPIHEWTAVWPPGL